MELRKASWVAWTACVTVGVATILLAFAPALAASTGCSLVVGHENGANDAVQLAVNAALPGATICLRPGVYPEQVTIATPGLHLAGAGAAKTFLAPTQGTVNALDYDAGGAPLVAVVLVRNASGVVLSGITVNASGAAGSIGGCSPGLVGVDFQNVSSGKLTSSVVTGAELPPALLGCQTQDGVRVYTGHATTGYTPNGAIVTVSGTTVSAYGKRGIFCEDPGLTCVIKSDRVVGLGPTSAIAANGIEVASGAVGRIAGDRVSGNVYTGASATNAWYAVGWSATGILLVGAGNGTTVTGSTLTGNQIGICAYQDVSDRIAKNSVVNSIAYGIVAYGEPGYVGYVTGNHVQNPATGSVGIFVANGTFTVRGNQIGGSVPNGTQGASQPVTGPGTVFPNAPAASISTAAIQVVSDGGPTNAVLHHNLYWQVSSPLAVLAVLGGSVTISH